MKEKKKAGRMRRRLVMLLAAAFVLLAAGGCALLAVNFYVKTSVEERILPEEDAAKLEADCILVLGAGVHPDGVPSNMLEDRLLQGIALYEAGSAPKLIMSGDHGRVNYDEVNVMKDFAMERGVPSADIFMDHAGFSTYESMYRAKEIFQAQTIVVVTQRYHLYRALYIAKKLGLDAYGVSSAPRVYAGQRRRDVREILARAKDFVITIYKPEPKYLGDAIPVSGDGNLTNDRKEGE